MNYVNNPFPIRTIESVHRLAPEYFKKPKTTQAGESRVMVGKLLLTPQHSTLFVVRALQRERVMRRTFNEWNGRHFHSIADYYRGSSRCFRVCEITWADANIVELSQHASRDEADAALHAEHNSR